jgi:hypothetical protein
MEKKKTNYWLIAVEIFAIAACYMLVAWPLASATNVNIIFNGQAQATADLSMDTLLSKSITSKHEPSDVTWTDVKVVATISSASLSHTVEKIYLYKCKSTSPSACVMTEPQVFDKWIDTELAWKDVSEREGTSTYPQVANLLIIIKLVGPNGRISWVGSWDTVKRTDYNVFNTYSHEISTLDFYAKSADLVLPAKAFMEGFQMVPFSWADRVVFQGAGSLHGLGGTESELSSSPPKLQSAQPTSNEITTINKDFYFVLSETSSGVSVPLTLNLNPDFNCGDGVCEIDLGETRDTCCYDCGCASTEYCDASQGQAGSCKNEDAIAIQVQPITTPMVTDCSIPFTANIKVKVNSPPSTLADTMQAYMTLDQDIYTSTCTKASGPEYNCPINIDPEIRCGSGSRQKGPNTVNVSLAYHDGANVVTKDLSASFNALTVSYDCACQTGFYCDSGETRCKPEGSIGLQILNVTSYMPNYNPSGDNIEVNARITNPPSDLTTTGTANYMLGKLLRGNTLMVNGTSGNAQCTGGASTGHLYHCSIPLSISNYNHESAYYVKGNSLTFSVSYSNGGTQMVKDLTAQFSDITIPSYQCGDGVLNAEETEDNCCQDAGCSAAGTYCDAVRGCSYINNVTMSVVAVQPKETTDCKRINTINITGRVNNVPYMANINYVHYYLGGEMQNWGLDCTNPNPVTGLTYCQLQIPPIDDCQLPFYTVGPNSLNFTVSFYDGLTDSITREINTAFEDIKITPVYHCGQFGCETEFGESGENCCLDCGCVGGEYCDYEPQYNPDGQCRDRSDIRLVIDSPSAPVNLQSCEMTHKLTVMAHIENEPSGVALEGWYGTLNGESTEKLVCRESRSRLRTTINKSYECEILIPSIHECTKGAVHNYDNNSLSFFISYTDGVGRRATQTLTTPIQQVTMTQGIRSLYDITQDAIGQMQNKVSQAMDHMEELLDIMEFCIKMMIFTTLFLVGATLVVGMGGFKDTLNINDGEKFSSKVKAMSTFSNFVMTAQGNICEMLSKYYEIQIKIIDAEMEMIQMQMCLDVIQHEIDSGRCENREQSCFSQTASCLRFGEVSKVIGDMSSYMSSTMNDALEINNAWGEVGDAWDDITGGAGGVGGASFIAECSGNSQTECCSAKPRVTYYRTGGYGNCLENTFEIVLKGLDDCDFAVILQKDPGKNEWKEARVGDNSYPMSLSSLSLTGDYEFGYLCFDEAKDYSNHKTNLNKNSEPLEPVESIVVTLGKDLDNDCDCTDRNEGGLSQSVTGVSSTTGSILNDAFLQQRIQDIQAQDLRIPDKNDDEKKALQEAIKFLGKARQAGSNVAGRKTEAALAVGELEKVTSQTSLDDVDKPTFDDIKREIQSIIDQINREIGRTTTQGPSQTPASQPPPSPSVSPGQATIPGGGGTTTSTMYKLCQDTTSGVYICRTPVCNSGEDEAGDYPDDQAACDAQATALNTGTSGAGTTTQWYACEGTNVAANEQYVICQDSDCSGGDTRFYQNPFDTSDACAANLLDDAKARYPALDWKQVGTTWVFAQLTTPATPTTNPSIFGGLAYGLCAHDLSGTGMNIICKSASPGCDSGHIPSDFGYDSYAECINALQNSLTEVQKTYPNTKYESSPFFRGLDIEQPAVAATVFSIIQTAGTPPPPNQPPTGAITTVGPYNIHSDGQIISTPLPGVITIKGTASDPNGNDDIADIWVRALHSQGDYLNGHSDPNVPRAAAVNWDPNTGNWDVDWDTSPSNIYDGFEYNIIVIVEDKGGERDNTFNARVTVEK